MTKKNYENKYYSLCETIKQNYGKINSYYYKSALSKAKSYLNDLKGYELKIRTSLSYKPKGYDSIFKLYENV